MIEHTTKLKCDCCHEAETVTDGTKLKKQYWKLGIAFEEWQTYKPQYQCYNLPVLWCRDCMVRHGLLTDSSSAPVQQAMPAPTRGEIIEELIATIAREAVENAD